MLCDDIRTQSGIAQVGRETILNSCHHYNWINLAGSIQHPDKGKVLDLSADTNKLAGIEDSSVFLVPVDGYGDPGILREVIKREKPDAIFLITDPRYYIWLFQMENEIRKNIPIIYLNIWDDQPTPHFNREYYQSCDLLMGISKQTKQINKSVLEQGCINYYDLDEQIDYTFGKSQRSTPSLVTYTPHGLEHKHFFPLNIEQKQDPNYINFRNSLIKDGEKDFVLLFNSRNIRRKSIPDLILAWKMFMDTLPKEKQAKCSLILHTEAVSEHGTDLPAVIEYFFPEEDNIVLSLNKLGTEQMNWLYNMADGVVLLSSNEGWGLSLTEALLTGTPIIANVTGGMQDQMRFEDEEGNWYTPSKKVPSNHKGTYKKCGNWALPVFPGNCSIQGSPVTPYIYDDRCSSEDAAKQIEVLYLMDREEREKRGLEGREWAVSDEAGFTSEQMTNKIIKSMDVLFKTWKPREKFEFVSDSDFIKRNLNHEMQY